MSVPSQASYRSDLSARGLKISVLCSRFNEAVCEQLLSGTLATLTSLGADADKVKVLRVPGAFELPLAMRLAIKEGADAVIALGTVVKGETPHFDFVCSAVAQALNNLSVKHRVALGFGLVTTLTQEQALQRAGGAHGNRGSDAAAAAVEMALVLRSRS